MEQSIDFNDVEEIVYQRFDRSKTIKTLDEMGQTHSVQVKARDYYIIDSFEPHQHWLKFCNELRTCPAGIEVNIHSKSRGGCCATAYQVIHAIKACKARTTYHMDGPCYSMGAIMALTTNTLKFSGPEVFLMFHNYSGGQYGKGGELKEATHNTDVWLEKALSTYCAPFLSKKEIKDILKDNDVYIHATDDNIDKRLQRHFK